MSNIKVTVVTLVYGDRWKFLSKTIDPIMKDKRVCCLIIVDNASTDEQEISSYIKQYGDRVIYLRNKENLGSAGGFHVGIAQAQKIESDYVLLLDDDMIPEEGYIDLFLQVQNLFERKVVLSGSRPFLLENKEAFYQPVLGDTSVEGTFFDVFSFSKLRLFKDLLFGNFIKQKKRGPFVPIIPTKAFVYGGAFIPIEAIREAKLPDVNLFLYGDDVEYSWNIKKLGYESYLCSRPVFQDIDFTFGGNQSHIFGQFDKRTTKMKVFYRLRNMIKLSRRHSEQFKVVLFLNITVWVFGLCILGLLRNGFTSHYFSKLRVISYAFLAGYDIYNPTAKQLSL